MAFYSDEELRNMSQAQLSEAIAEGRLTVNQYRRAKGWLEVPDGDREIKRYSDLDRHVMDTPRFDQVDSPSAKDQTHEVSPDFAYGLVFGLLLAAAFWVVIALPLWLVLR